MATLPGDGPFLTEQAPAKINLDLRVTGRRDDGYHLLDSIVVFADCGDVLDYYPGDTRSFEITGPFSQGLEADDGNLVLRAIAKFEEKSGLDVTGRFVLTKNLPVASGIGGGSADAAAALRLLDRLYPDVMSPDELRDMALSLGADVPACLVSRTLRMQSVGEEISPLQFAFPLYILLANPGIAVETAGIFRTLRESGFVFTQNRELPGMIDSFHRLVSLLEGSSNDLQAPACQKAPEISDLIARIAASEGCRFAAMSGSGATCFGLFETIEAARSAGENISMDSKNYWTRATLII